MVKKKKETKRKTKEKKVDEVAEVKKITKELFSLIGTKSSVEVSEDKENEAILVDVKSDDEAGLLIGNRGETLNSIQTVIGMIYRKTTGEWKRILVNVADWREKQQDRLTQLATQTAQRVKESGQPQSLYNLSASQRRVIHMTLVDDKELKTESQGEDQDRYIVVSLKSEEKE